MKKEVLIGLCLIAFIGGIVLVAAVLQLSDTIPKNTKDAPFSDSLQSTSGDILGSGQSTSRIVLNTTIMKSQSHVKLYKTLPKVITKADVIIFAKKFNMSDLNEPNEGDTVISVSSKDMRYRAILSKNGGKEFEDSFRSHKPNGIDILENLPSDKEAEKISTAFLKERNLLPAGAVPGGIKHNKVIAHYSDGTTKVSWEDILIGYTREINNMPVEGTQFMVEVGANGDIISFFANWKDYEFVGDYPIKSGESAFEKLKQKGIKVSAGFEKPDSIIIDQAYLAYHTTALAYHEDYLEPVWVFKGQAQATGKSIMSVEEYIPALTATPPTGPAPLTRSN